MKKKIYDIVFAAQYEGLTTKEATDQMLVLLDVVGRSEQFICDCGKPYHERDLEHGMCHKCWEPVKEAN